MFQYNRRALYYLAENVNEVTPCLSFCALQSTKYLLELGKFHRLSGIPHDYFGVMGTIFVHAVRPYWEEAGCMSEETEDVWMALFAHIARGASQ